MIIPQTHSPRKETEIEIETVTETELKLKLMQQMKQTSLTYKWTVEKWSEAAKRGNGVDRQYADKSPNNTHRKGRCVKGSGKHLGTGRDKARDSEEKKTYLLSLIEFSIY